MANQITGHKLFPQEGMITPLFNCNNDVVGQTAPWPSLVPSHFSGTAFLDDSIAIGPINQYSSDD